jgi:HSP20 family molecular chaperone IbpA
MSIFNNLIPSRSDAANATTEDSRELGATIKPAYEIKETPEAFGLTVYLPGVAKAGLDLTAEEGQFRIVGRRAWAQPESWTSLYRESRQAPFELVLTHDNAVDTDKVAAELRDGVLRVSLPKHEALKPRKIAVN